MNYLKNKFSKIVIFIVVLSLLLLLIIPAGIIFGNSDKDLKEEYGRALITLKTAQEEVARAESDLESAKLIEAEARANLEAVGQKLTVINENYAGVSPEVEKLKEKLVFAQAAAEEAGSFYERIKETGTEEEINIAKEVTEKANAELELASAEYNEANSNLMALQKELDEAKAEFEKVKSAADEANANLLYAEKILNEKNENLKYALAEVEKAKAELEAYQAKIAENEESNVTDEENTAEALADVETSGETLEDNSTEEEIVNETAQTEEGTAGKDESTTEADVTEEVVTEESINTETSEEGKNEISEEELPEEGLSGEEVVQEGEEASSEIVEAEEVEEEVIEVASELVPEGETVGEEAAVEETGEVKIDISFSRDENGYIQAGQITTFGAAVEGIVPFQYFWDFGDGSSLASQSPQYAYRSDGNYTLSLTILDVDGNAYSKSVTVNVSDYDPTTTEYWISSDAGDGGTGTIDNPASISTVLSHTVNGDTLYFLPGTYNTSVNLDGIGTGTEELPINFIAYDNVIFDGQSTLDSAFYFSSSLSYLSFYNFIFINYLDSAIYINNEDVININIVDNTFSGNGAAIDITMDSGLNITNNIIVDNNAGVVISADDVNIEHNVIAFNEEGIVVDDTRDNITIDYNDVFGNGTDYQSAEPGENDISVDPMFTDKDNLDFTLLKDSPLLDNKIIRISSTDKEDYSFGEQVIIIGSGYGSYQDLIIKILRSDGTFVDDIHITTDENGNFTYDKYSVDYTGKNYLVEIIDADKNILEVLSFTDCHPTIELKKDGFPSCGLPAGEYAEFTLYYSNGTTPVPGSVRTLSKNGTVTWNLSAYGTYWIKETHIPNGYIKINDIKVDTSEDITYTVCATNEKINGDITLNKTGLDAGVTAGFTLYNSSEAAVGAEKTVTGNGSVNWNNLPWDTYKIVETTTPNGYIPIADITGIVVGSTQQVYSFNRENEKVIGEISLTKSGLEETDEVTFTLTGPGYSHSYTVSAASPTAIWSNLAQGTYTLTETPDPSNIYNYTLTVTPPGPYDIGIEDGESLTYTLGAVNTPEFGEITLTKSGLEGSDKVTFTLTGPNNYSKSYKVGNETVTWTDLEYGTYTLTETPDPTNISIYKATVNPEGPYNIGIGVDENLTYTINVINKPDCEITLNKTGLDSTDIVGFTLYNSAGAAVGSEKIITGNGSVTWSDLSWDTYKIVETTVPTGYSKMDDITNIVIGANQQHFSFSRTNTKITVLGSITLNKSGLGSKDTAGFTLYNSIGDAIGGEKKITGNGSVTWKDLPLDTYRIVETTVPAGYSKMSNIIGIVVGPAQQSFSFSRTNTKTPPPSPPPTTPPVIEVFGIQELPFTGMNPFVPIAGISSIIAGVVLLALSISRRMKINLESNS